MVDVNAFFKVSYGLYIVSSGNRDKGNGFISNSVFQVTSEPAQFAACCNKDNYTAELIKSNKHFSISVLAQDASMDLIGLFGYSSGKSVNKFENAQLSYGESGIPVVTNDAVAFFECKLVQTFDVGSHLVFIGEVVNSKHLSDKEALTYDYYRNVKKGLAPKNAPTYINKEEISKKEDNTMNEVYKCPVCGYEHDVNEGDPKSGIEPKTSWNEIPDTYQCPLCGAPKEDFYKL